MPIIPMLRVFSKDYRITPQESYEIIDGMIRSAIIVLVISTAIVIAVRGLDLCDDTEESLEMMHRLGRMR